MKIQHWGTRRTVLKNGVIPNSADGLNGFPHRWQAFMRS
jgi:hypothetical protein